MPGARLVAKQEALSRTEEGRGEHSLRTRADPREIGPVAAAREKRAVGALAVLRRAETETRRVGPRKPRGL